MKWSYVIIILQTVIEWQTHWYICIVNLDWVHILFCLMCQVETDHTLGLGSIPHGHFLPWRVQSNLAVWLPFAGRCYRSVVKDWGTTCNLLDTIRCKCRLINIETLRITRKKDMNVLMLRMVIVMSGLVDQLSCHPPTVNFCKTSNNSVYLDAMAILGNIWRTSLFNATNKWPAIFPSVLGNLHPNDAWTTWWRQSQLPTYGEQ